MPHHLLSSSGRRRASLVLASVLLLPLMAAAQAPPAPGAPGEGVTLVFPGSEVNLEWFVVYAEKYSKRRFIFQDESIKNKKIFLYSASSPIPAEHYLAVFQEVLAMNKFVLIPVPDPSGGSEPLAYKIVQTMEAASQPAPVMTAGEIDKLPFDERWVCGVFKLQYVPVNDMVPTLMNFVSNPKGIIPLPSAGAVLVCDYGLNVKRVGEILKVMDVPGPSPEVRVIRLKQAAAVAVEGPVAHVAEALEGSGAPRATGWKGGGPAFAVVAEPRGNALVIAAAPRNVPVLVRLVEDLDVAAAGPVAAPSMSVAQPAGALPAPGGHEKSEDARKRWRRCLPIAGIALLHIGFATWVFVLARREGTAPWAWGFLGLLFGPIAVLLFLLTSIRAALRQGDGRNNPG